MRFFRSVRCRVCSRQFPSGYFSEFVCPFCTRKAVVGRVRELLKGDVFFGAAPAPFVGRFGYPYVNVGVLSPGDVEDAAFYDAPSAWADRGLSISEVVDFRSSLVNSRSKAQVKGYSKVMSLGQEVAMSSRPVDVEVSFDRKPFFSVAFSNFSAPTGASVDVKGFRLASNPKIHAKVERAYSDVDVRASDSLASLYSEGFDVNFLSRILSVAVLGFKPDRRLVPTRFSITAVDDIIGKSIIGRVRAYDSVDECLVLFGGYLGNYFFVVFFPGVWGFELFEAYAGKSGYSTDFEPYSGRNSYAVNCVGGYYAARLSVLEKLDLIRRQASVLVVRIITDEYVLPVGVWAVRESVKKSVSSRPLSFSSKELALKYVEALARSRFGHNVTPMLVSSRLLASLNQVRLDRFGF